PRPVVGDLAATIAHHHGNVARVQQVFGFARLPQGVHRGVFAQPDLVGRVVGARGREGLHVVPDRGVIGRSGQPPDHGARLAVCVTAQWTPWGVRAARDTGYRAALERWPAR